MFCCVDGGHGHGLGAGAREAAAVRGVAEDGGEEAQDRFDSHGGSDSVTDLAAGGDLGGLGGSGRIQG